MNVPFCDLGRESRELERELTEAAARVIRSGRFLFGPELEAFEHEIAEWHGVKHAVGVASGTDGVELALRATHEGRASLGLRAEPVTLPAFCPPPCINAVEAAGEVGSLVDIDPVTRMGKFTTLAVHMFGMAQEAEWADVEDCAHSMGATVNGKLAGTMGACGAISFFPSKTLGAIGDGGVIITDSAPMAETLRRLRHYGVEETGDIHLRGQNSRLSEMQAAALRVKLPLVKGWIERRRQIAERYTAELRGKVAVPFESVGVRSVWHVYAVEHPERDRLKKALNDRGIGTQVHYARAIHQYGRWAHLGREGAFVHSERLAATVLSLPCYPYLTDEEQTAVIEAVKAAT